MLTKKMEMMFVTEEAEEAVMEEKLTQTEVRGHGSCLGLLIWIHGLTGGPELGGLAMAMVVLVVDIQDMQAVEALAFVASNI